MVSVVRLYHRHPAAWRSELRRRNEHFGAPQGYFCYLPGGVYRIGGWEQGQPAARLRLAAFWIARVPITNAQYRAFLEAGGYRQRQWWTPNGWQWKQEKKRAQPWLWDDSRYNAPDQPALVTWYEASAFCAWLTAQVHDSLPAGRVLRLPTEAEWEVAAAWDGAGGYRVYPWGEAPPTPERAIFKDSGRDRPALVGSCPAGAAACGALDMAGNAWEWTARSDDGYQARSGTPVKEFKPDKWDCPLYPSPSPGD